MFVERKLKKNENMYTFWISALESRLNSKHKLNPMHLNIYQIRSFIPHRGRERERDGIRPFNWIITMKSFAMQIFEYFKCAVLLQYLPFNYISDSNCFAVNQTPIYQFNMDGGKHERKITATFVCYVSICARSLFSMRLQRQIFAEKLSSRLSVSTCRWQLEVFRMRNQYWLPRTWKKNTHKQNKRI